MRSAVIDDNFDPGDGQFHLGTFGQGALEALFAGRNILSWNGASPYLVFEDKIFITYGLHVTRYTTVLAGTTGLFFMDVVEGSHAGDGLPIGHPGHAGDHTGSVFPEHALDIDLQVKLPHAGDNGISGFVIDMHFKCRIFFGKPGQCFGHVGFGFIIFGPDGQRDYGIRHIHGRHGYTETRSCKGVPGCAVYPEKGTDVTGRDTVDILHLVCMDAD